MLAHLITTQHELTKVLLRRPPDAHVVGVDADEDDPIVILFTDLLPGPIVQGFVPGGADLDLSLPSVDDPIMLRRSGTLDTMPERLHHLLNHALTLSAFGLGGWDVAEGLELAALPDGLLAALPLLIDGEGFDECGVGHGPLWWIVGVIVADQARDARPWHSFSSSAQLANLPQESSEGTRRCIKAHRI